MGSAETMKITKTREDGLARRRERKTEVGGKNKNEGAGQDEKVS